MSYDGPERRNDESSRKFIELELRMNNLERKVDENIMMTSGVFEIVQHGKSFFTVLGLVGNVVKWTAGIIVIVAGAFAVWTGKN
jgi:hypothetical protein